ncbi:max dimerization protein 1-like [Cyprinus carpio]|uniref:Max dimerization protein 1-like n=1 Tax=Cyprinus carpio TaxID=7962 RepID=A0A9Q9Y3X1_CYPCA|nr:max dimerization protein 1-like [Cyprinus carpio]
MTAVEKLQMLIEAAEYLDRREREAEHGYASMLPFTSNKERDGLKRKIKNKKNCSSRSTHNEMEKNRRAHLRLCLERLKSLVPLGPDSNRHTTLSLLMRAKEHIKRLEDNKPLGSSDRSDSDQEVDVDVEGTDYLLADLEWSMSSVSDSDERGSLRSSCSDEGYSSASLRRLADPQDKSPALALVFWKSTKSPRSTPTITPRRPAPSNTLTWSVARRKVLDVPVSLTRPHRPHRLRPIRSSPAMLPLLAPITPSWKKKPLKTSQRP